MTARRGLPQGDDPLDAVLGSSDAKPPKADKAQDEAPERPKAEKRPKATSPKAGSASASPASKAKQASAKDAVEGDEAQDDGGDEAERRQRTTFTLSPGLVERLRDAAWHYRRPLAHLAEDALTAYLEALEDEHGPVPERPTEAELQRGRPLGPRRA